MENLVALDLSNSKLQQLWKKPKLLRSLKFLNLSSCHELVRVGHFSGLPLLERLTLARCTSLIEVCESIGTCCQKLEILDLSECDKLTELPRSIGKLKNLTQLLIDGCSNLGEFPADNVNMKSHGSSSSTMVPRTPESFASSLPRSLVTLSLKNCNLYNESFPMDFSNLPMLKNLFLDKNPMDSIPDCVRSLTRLETISFSWCRKLKTVLCPPIQLKQLKVIFCDSLEKIKFHPEKSAVPRVFYEASFTLTEIQHIFKIQALSEIDEEVLWSLGWINIAYLNHCRFSKAGLIGDHNLEAKKLPAQMLYEHGIFSTYLQGQEVPKWFTHRSNGSLFTLQSSPEKGKIKGLNVCIVQKISGMKYIGPSRIKIRNLTKKSSWTYQPTMYHRPEYDAFGYGGKDVVVWLSHWMFGKNEFEDGDKVLINFSVKHYMSLSGLRYGGEGPEYANVREYGISPVYDDDGGGKQKADALGYYKSWKHIIGGDLFASEVSPSHYLLHPYSWLLHSVLSSLI